jgi:triacylglycerol esterase/lipase EstA (alpha/beta hydrolase family)
MAPLSRFLEQSGWPTEAIHPIEFRDPFGSNIEHAEEIARALATLRQAGAATVDVVAHSMGGLALRRYLVAAGDSHGVARAVFLATPHAGTYAAWLAYGASRREMLPGSIFLRGLGDLPPDIRTVCIHTPWDLRVFPRGSALLGGVDAIRVERVTHRGLLRDARVHQAILNALLAA